MGPRDYDAEARQLKGFIRGLVTTSLIVMTMLLAEMALAAIAYG